MKILHVIPSIDLIQGGPSRALLDMVQALKQKGMDNTILTTKNNRTENPSYPDLEIVKFESQFGYRWGVSLALRKWLLDHMTNYDRVHLHSLFSYTTVCTAELCMRNQIPYILRPAGALDQFSFSQKQWKKQLFMLWVGAQIIKNAQVVHCTSSFEERQILARIPEAKTKVVPLGTNITRRVGLVKKESDKFTIVYLGRLYPHKGIEILLGAVAQLRERNYPVCLIICGSGAEKYELSLKTIMQKLKIGNSVEWKGFLEEKEKTSQLEASDVLMLPSHHENFGISVIEAMACGLPVVVSTQVGISDDVQKANAGIVVEPNVSQTTVAIEHFLKHRKDLAIIGGNGEKLVNEKFRWPAIAAQWAEIYRQM